MEEGALLALVEKLRELLALRGLGAADPPTERLRALAARFPGALRELDRTSSEELSAQLDALTAALAGGPVPDWAMPMCRRHGWLRVGLRLRVEAARTEVAAAAWAARYVPEIPGDPPRARLVPSVLAALVTPPSGRLVPLASRLTAEDLGMTLEALEALLGGR